MKQFLFSDFFKIFALTIALFGATFLITSCFYETNDDIILTFLLNGIFTGQSVSDLSLYLHGLSSILAKLYQFFPGWPWYGLVLYLLLFIITLLAFRFIYYALKPALAVGSIYLVIILFYIANWYEHIFWFNYSRLALLLAGLAGLNTWLDIRQGQPVAGKKLLGYSFLFFLALCIRPSMAWYGLGIILPILIFSSRFSWVISRRTVFFTLPFLLASLVFSGWLLLNSTPAQNEYRRQDILKSQILDYNWCCQPPAQPANKLLYTGINNWFFADKNILLFLKQRSPNWNYFRQQAAVPKLKQLLRYLIFDQFVSLALLLMYFTWLFSAKRKEVILPLIGYHLFFWSLIFFTGIFLKIPPRILTPAISLLLLAHLVWLPTDNKPRNLPLLFKLFGWCLLLTQFYKINHRVLWQQQRQKQSETVLAQINGGYPGYLVVAAGLENELRALSPFKNYNFRKQRVLWLTGWQTLDPHYSGYLRFLSGRANLAEALETLLQRKKVVWVSSPRFASFLIAYYKYFYQIPLRFTLIKPVKGSALPENLCFYKVERSD